MDEGGPMVLMPVDEGGPMVLMPVDEPEDCHIDFLRRCAGNIGEFVIDVFVDGNDNGSHHTPVLWTPTDRRLYVRNEMLMTRDFVAARDKAHAKIVFAGFASEDMETMLTCDLMPTFARLTAYFYRQHCELRDIRQDISSFFQRKPLMRRSDFDECVMPRITRLQTRRQTFKKVPRAYIDMANRMLQQV